MKLIKTISILASISLVLNLVWEFSHFVLYNDTSGIPKTLHLIMASFTDVLWIFLIFAIISLIYKNMNWINKPQLKHYALIILLGFILSTLIELINLNLGRWSYLETMPTIFGIGLTPLIQLVTTGILSLLIYKKIVNLSQQLYYSSLSSSFR